MFKNVYLKCLKINLNSSKQFPTLFKKYFNTTPAANTPATGKEQQISAQPPKTKEQLKVEALMQQWPEHVRNPKTIEMQKIKEYFEFVYKYHQGDKKYLGPFDMPAPIMSEMEYKINSPKTTDAIAELFQDYEGFLPDQFIFKKFHQIATTHRDKTPELYNIILPQVKKHILTCDRQNSGVLYYAVEAGSLLNLQDKEFWSMIEFKLQNERLYRYLTLEQAAKVAFHLVLSGNGSKTLLKQLEVNFIKHRKALHLDKQLLGFVSATYSIIGATPTLFAALEDPNIEVPGIDPKLPKMHKLGESAKHGSDTHLLNEDHKGFTKKLH